MALSLRILAYESDAGYGEDQLDLYPNPKKRILEGNPQYGGKMVTDLL